MAKKNKNKPNVSVENTTVVKKAIRNPVVKEVDPRDKAILLIIKKGDALPTNMFMKVFKHVHDIVKGNTAKKKAKFVSLLKDNYPLVLINNYWRDEGKTEKPEKINTKEDTAGDYVENEAPEPEEEPDSKDE